MSRLISPRASSTAPSVQQSDHEEDSNGGNGGGDDEDSDTESIDPDAELEEDFLGQVQDDDEFQGEGRNATHEGEINFGVIGQAVEMNNDKYAQKWRKYKAERNSLVRGKHKIQCKPAKVNSIEIGRRVKEKGRGGRTGLVVDGDEELRFGSRPQKKWSIRFDGSNEIEHNFRSTQLTVIKDTRVLEWTVVEDSFPENPVTEYHDHGLIDFDFDRLFSDEQLELEVDDERYEFPYLKLLIELWPGMLFYLYKILPFMHTNLTCSIL